MNKYRVDTENGSIEEFDSLEKALIKYEETKDCKLRDGVTEDSFVELVYSDDGFENYKVLKRAMIAVDEEQKTKEQPKGKRLGFIYEAVWEELIHGAVKLLFRN